MSHPVKALQKALSGSSEHIYSVLRIVTGLLFAFHGAQKVLGIMASSQPEMFSQIWIGGVIELITGALVALGLFTQLAAFLASGTMAVAYIQFHWKFQFNGNVFPAINHGELGVVYSFCLLYIASVGDGRWSVGASRARDL
jgi:putative oxidoreductase